MATTTLPDPPEEPRVRTILRSEIGASIIEYALIVSLVSIVALAGIARVGMSTEETFDETAVALESDDSPEAEAEGEGSADGGATATVPGGGTASGGGSTSGGSSTSSDGGSGGTDTSDSSESTTGDSEPGGDDEATGSVETSGEDASPDESTTSGGAAEGPDDDTASGDTGDDGEEAEDGEATGGTEEEAAPEVVTETAGIYGQFQVKFVLEDDAVELDGVETSSWSYRILKDQRQRMVLRLTNSETRERFKVRCWITSSGTLTSTITRN